MMSKEAWAVGVCAAVLLAAGLAIQPPPLEPVADRRPGDYHRYRSGSRVPLCEEYCAGAFDHRGSQSQCPRCEAIARELEGLE
jgi:hypothetical protein